MEGNHHVKCDSITYRKGAVHRTERERLFLAAKGFNNNLVQFLPLYHVISNVCICSFMCTRIPYVHGHASKRVLGAQDLVYKNL